MGVQRGEAGPTNQSPRGLEFGNALARGGQLFLQLGDARLQLADYRADSRSSRRSISRSVPGRELKVFRF